jgi:nucleoside-diphosphate kinase
LFFPATTMSRTLALIKPDVAASAVQVRAVLEHVAAHTPLQVAARRRLVCSVPLAAAFYAEHAGRFYHQRLLEAISSGPLEALVLVGPDAIATWRATIGPTHPPRARVHAPTTLRARYGLTDTRNGFHGSGAVGITFPWTFIVEAAGAHTAWACGRQTRPRVPSAR